MSNNEHPGLAVRYRALLESSPFAVVGVDAALRIEVWSGRGEELLGVSAATAEGKALAEVLTTTAGSAGWETLLAGGRGARRMTAHRVGGKEVFVEWSSQPLHDEEGKVLGALLHGQDVTEREGAAREHKVEQKILKAILEHLPMVAWAITPDGTFTFQQGKALERAGLTQGQFLGQNIFSLYGSGSGLVRRSVEGHLEHYHSSEHDIDWENWQIPVFNEANKVTDVVGITLDVTEAQRGERVFREKLEIIERQQQAIRALSTPVIEVWDRVLTLPLIGLVDGGRAVELMDNLLQTVVRTRARFAILDMTGVEGVDTATAGHLLGLVRAIRLLGAEGIVTGIRPGIAQTIVSLGVELSGLLVRSSLREALQFCISEMDREQGNRGRR